MNLVSLCSGYGGLDLAVEAAFGATTVAYSEVEDAPSQVFARHWPDARPLGDLTTVDWTTVDADIVCAGFPCQDLSYAGKGRGIVADSRSGLWYAIEHALGVLRPRYVVLENVSAIVARRPGLDVVLAGLASLGFDAVWTCVRASDVGAPHRRERWFLVAHADGQGQQGRGRTRPGGRSIAAGTGGEKPVADADRIAAGRDSGTAPRPQATDAGRSEPDERDRSTDGRGALAHADGGRCIERREQNSRSQRPGLEASRRGDVGGRDTPTADTDGQRHVHGQPGIHPTVGRVDALRDAPASGPDPATWGEFAPAVARWERIIGRPAPAPTDDRGRLSPPFVEWMMGLPAGWVTDTPGLSRSKQLKCLGNGVVPQQAVYALASLLGRQEVAA